MSYLMVGAICDVEDERRAQNAKWGDVDEQDRFMPFGTGDGTEHITMAATARALAQQKMKEGTCTWLDVLREEFLEVAAESEAPENWPSMRREIIQVAAVAVAMVEAGDLRAINAAQAKDECADSAGQAPGA